MTASWLPSWPSAWVDLVTQYATAIPSEWPRGLFRTDGQAHADHQALGEVLAYVRQAAEWMLRTILPQNDDDELFLDRWEDALGLQSYNSAITTRQQAIVAEWRRRGTVTDALVRSILCAAWGSDDPAVVSLASPDPADVDSVDTLGEETSGRHQSNLHIYRTEEGEAPDYLLAEYLIDRIKPASEHWSVGQYRTGIYDSGTYDRCVWG